MTAIAKSRIESIDLLKGLVMVIMALDHVRDFFHYSAFIFDPSDPAQSTLPIFFTRFITHFCAPAFSFLAGSSAYMAGKRKTKKELSIFLVKRGLWLIFIEMTIVNFAWYFDIYFRSPEFLVIWCLGISMIVLAGLIHFPLKAILIFSCLLIFGHNLLDTIHFDGNFFWVILHEQSVFKISNSYKFYVDYPMLPWVGVMALGYYFGSFYNKTFDPAERKNVFNIISISAIALFVALKWTNMYGEPNPFKHFGTAAKDLMSFLQLTKYPPSLLFLLVTLGGVFLFLANTEKLRGSIVKFFCVFGRVPFFYYILHLYLIHLFALVLAQLTGFGWESMILTDWMTEVPALQGYGFNLFIVYLIWIGVVLLLYPLCRKFDVYKQTHKEKWWLSYL
jgi:uncharacterized membrane protein